VRCNARAAFYCAALQALLVRRAVMTMNTGLSRIELTGPPSISNGPESTAAKFFKPGFLWLPAALLAGLGAWMLLSGYVGEPAESEPARMAAAGVAVPPGPSPAVAPGPIAFNPPTAEGEAIVPEETAPVDGLKISSQYWRRGGLGSKALVTFTVRNGNDYAVKDIEITCAFARRDGSHLTDRTRLVHDTVNMKSRKTFARMHVGFVNINASKAKCSLVAARHI
jgi:hypothetical protein